MGDLLRSTDAEIDEHVQSADPMALRGVLFQLTGDPAIAATKLGEVPGRFTPLQGLIDPADIELIRVAAASYLRARIAMPAPPMSDPVRPSGSPPA